MPVVRQTKTPQSRLNELFIYDEETGALTRRIDIRSGRGSEYGSGKIQCRAGDVAGKINKSTGYLDVRVDGPIMRVHRIIWCMVYGYYPEHDIDHIDRDKSNNRLSNLREVTRSCNIKNRPILTNNVSGVCGVSFCNTHQKWKAVIDHNGKRKSLGYHKDFIDAVKRRYNEEQALDWHDCDSRSTARKALVEAGVLQ